MFIEGYRSTDTYSYIPHDQLDTRSLPTPSRALSAVLRRGAHCRFRGAVADRQRIGRQECGFRLQTVWGHLGPLSKSRIDLCMNIPYVHTGVFTQCVCKYLFVHVGFMKASIQLILRGSMDAT